jgi:hypothetical protein
MPKKRMTLKHPSRIGERSIGILCIPSKKRTEIIAKRRDRRKRIFMTASRMAIYLRRNLKKH